MAAQVTVRGMVNADGTSEDWWQYLQRSRAELEASGASFRRPLEIEATIDQLRGDVEPVDAVYWEAEWQKHHGGTAETSGRTGLGISLARI